MERSVGILGSTGSIGVNALKVVKRHSGHFSVKYLSAHSNAEKLVEQALDFQPEVVAISDENSAKTISEGLAQTSIKVLTGREGLLELASRNDVDICLNALVGSAGMEPTVRALEAGVDLALSNKESLVMAGGLIRRIMDETGAALLPVDSEHSAIWQCLLGEKVSNVRRLILTGSGGPFRTKPMNEFYDITVDEALNHPKWEMGKKITVDSATLMNKGLEVIEAHWLFGLNKEQIDIVIHPQSIIHSMVEFIDGSVKGQMGQPDMKIPIQFALTYPDRLEAEWEDFDPVNISELTFEKLDREKFPSISLAYEALSRGGTATAALNVANDNSVRLFLDGKIGFTQIAKINEAALSEHKWIADPDLKDLLELEQWGKSFVELEMKESLTV